MAAAAAIPTAAVGVDGELDVELAEAATAAAVSTMGETGRMALLAVVATPTSLPMGLTGLTSSGSSRITWLSLKGFEGCALVLVPGRFTVSESVVGRSHALAPERLFRGEWGDGARSVEAARLALRSGTPVLRFGKN